MNKLIVLIVLIVLLSLITSSCIVSVQPLIVTFESVPQNTISPGQNTNLVWVVTGVQSVIIEPGIGTVEPVGNRQVSPANTTTYTLTARGGGITVSRPVTVTVSTPAIAVNFEANPPVISAGETSTLQWSITGTAVNYATIEPGIGSVGIAGNRSVSPQNTTTYTLIAQGDTGPITKSVVVTVNNPPVVVSFTVFPESLEYGRSALLRWSTTGATKVRIEPDIGEVPSAGNYAVTPKTTTTYVLSAQSDCCIVSKSVVVSVIGFPTSPPYGPVVELFNITPNSIYRGESATLQWRVVGARTISIDQGIGAVPPSGSLTVTPFSSTTYTLTVANEWAFYPISVRVLVFER